MLKIINAVLLHNSLEENTKMKMFSLSIHYACKSPMFVFDHFPSLCLSPLSSLPNHTPPSPPPPVLICAPTSSLLITP